MTNFLKRQIQIIQQSDTLRLYGVALALTHVWTFFYWDFNRFFVNSQSSINSEPLCFPFVPSCDLLRAPFPDWFWQGTLYFYLLSALATTLFFWDKKTVKWGYWGLVGLSLLKLDLHLSNYNFMGNYHYMVHIISWIFLLVPQKKNLIKVFIVLFYLAAGLLKLNIDWLSGAAMISTPYLNGNLLVSSLYYVVALEIIMVFGLLAKNRWLRGIVLLQFIVFHIFSWHIVGFYYPLVMFSLLSIFILDEVFKEKDSKFIFRWDYSYLFVAVFVFMQALPFLFAKDPSLTGALRLTSLNMFDSRTTCHPVLIAHRENEVVQLQNPIKSLGVRLGCDPIIFLNQAHQLCRKNKETKNFDRLSFALLTKRITSKDFTKTIDLKDVCKLNNPLWAEFSKGGF